LSRSTHGQKNETRNQALKIVMDATDLKFLPESFDVCTSFFSFMYITQGKYSRVFGEAFRVLKDKAREHFKELAQKTSFKITDEWSKGEIFFLEMIKNV
jgi:ubiquinone/menaquinone biosynthesis C-methylase UbiE